jgi:hypothetical protein
MKQAIVKDGVVWLVSRKRITEIQFGNELIHFTDETTDAEYLTYGIYPYTEDGIPSRDVYHTNVTTFDIQDTMVIGTNVSTYVPIEKMKELKKAEINKSWVSSIQDGSFMSLTLSTRVDARRNDVDNDLQNIIEIINLCENDSRLLPFSWKCTNETQEVTLEQLKLLRLELAKYATEMYQQKFDAFDSLEATIIPEEILEISF